MTTPRQFPDRPDLDQLKRQAKHLLKAARDGAPDARARFRVLPALARAGDAELNRAPLALHDAQSVIAREYGFPSWNALRARVEELTLDFGAAMDQFIAAATDGRTGRAERLLALHPAIRHASLYTALVLGNAGAVQRRLRADPALAQKPGGARGWQPLHYVCHTSTSLTSEDGLVATARLLLDAGADPNARFPWEHHGVRRPVLWGATRATQSRELARLLLDAGADPNDGVTLPLAASAGDLPTLDLLLEFGADVNQPWATDASAALYAIMQWSTSDAGIRWLLEHGADPDPVFPGTGEAPLHLAARRWDLGVAQLLVEKGADPARPRADGRTPLAVAELSGNRAVADWLRTHGGDGRLSEVDRLVAACGRGDSRTCLALLDGQPALREELSAVHYAALFQAAERGDAPALEAMLACGFDPNYRDEEIGKTALHAAAMAAQPESVRVLLAHGADLTLRDREFHAQPLLWAVEGSRSHPGQGQGHREVGRLLLEAGSPTDWDPGQEPSEQILEILAEWRAELQG